MIEVNVLSHPIPCIIYRNIKIGKRDKACKYVPPFIRNFKNMFFKGEFRMDNDLTFKQVVNQTKTDNLENGGLLVFLGGNFH